MSTPSTISQIATTITLLVGLTVFWRQTNDRQREQIAKVAIWPHIILNDDGTRDIEYRLLNDSTQPLYDVTLLLTFSDFNHRREGTFTRPNDYLTASSHYLVLSPKFDEELPGMRTEGVTAIGDWNEGFRKHVIFSLIATDAQGRRWSRDEKGHLRRVYRSTERRLRQTHGIQHGS